MSLTLRAIEKPPNDVLEPRSLLRYRISQSRSTGFSLHHGSVTRIGSFIPNARVLVTWLPTVSSANIQAIADIGFESQTTAHCGSGYSFRSFAIRLDRS